MLKTIAAFDRIGEENAFAVLARAMTLAAQGRDIINLGIGQPDFRTPEHIVEAAVKALRDGHHGYTPATGILPLREAVAADLGQRYGVTVNPGEVIEANKELMRVTDLSSVWVVGQVYEKDLARIRVGGGAVITSDAYPGRIYKLTLDGKVLGVLGRSGKQLKQFGWIHEIACPSENELYVAELLNWRVQKLLLHPDAQQKAATAQ